MNLSGKTVIIIEGPDMSGKSSLCKFLQNYVDGKCHTVHSNFDKSLPKINHLNQHKLIAKFVKKQFDSKHYTGNRLVILDRNYVSDIVYGMISYGSKGNKKQKFKNLYKQLKLMSTNVDKIIFIYCNPENNNFDTKTNTREELLDNKENEIICKLYNLFYDSHEFIDIFLKIDNLYSYIYNYNEDPDYKDLEYYLRTGEKINNE